MLNAVNHALAFLNKLGGFDFRSDGKLPVGSSLALCDDRFRKFSLADNLTGNFKFSLDRSRHNHADTPKRMILMVGKQRYALRNGKSGHINDNRTRPSEKTHLPAGVRNAAHSRTLPLGSCDYR